MQITTVRVIVTCPAGQTSTLVVIMTDAGFYGVGAGAKICTGISGCRDAS